MTGSKWRCRLGSALITMGLAAGLVPLGATPVSGQVQEAEGAVTTFTNPNLSAPSSPVFAPDGNIWVVSMFNDRIARVLGSTGAITTFTHPGIEGPTGMAFNPADDKLWFTSGINNRIGTVSIHPAHGPVGAITMFPANAALDAPTDIVAAPNGTMWVAHSAGIANVAANGAVTNYIGPNMTGGADFMEVGTDGNVWFSAFDNDKIGRITPQGATTFFNVPSPMRGPSQMAMGPDGNLWVIGVNNGRIAKVNMSGVFTMLPALPNGQRASQAIAPGHDGNMWFFTEMNQIGRVTMAGVFKLYNTNQANQVQAGSGLVAGPGDRTWFTSILNHRVGYIEGAAIRRPDARVGSAFTGPFSGDNEYSTTPTPGQTIDATIAGDSLHHEFFLSVQNDGNQDDSFKIRVVEDESDQFTIKYVRAGVDITEAVLAGNYETPVRAPGESVVIKVKIKATGTATPGSTRGVDIRVKAGPIVDVVRFEAQR